MVTTTYDISDITESLTKALGDAIATWPHWKSNGGTLLKFTIGVSGSSPETVRGTNLKNPADCQLSLYLLHVGQNPYMRNTPVFGTSAMRNTQQPLALDLSYLLTAYAADNADQEQQAMSIALRCFHEQPISTASGEYLTITIGSDTLDEMSRLWQSFTVAYRLSAVIRVAVALITPSQAPDTASPPPRRVDIAVAPASEPLSVVPQLFDPSRTVSFAVPTGATDPTQVVTTATPLAATAGTRLLVGSQGLSSNKVTNVYLSTVDGTHVWDVSNWRIDATLDSELVLKLPSTYAIAPAQAVPASLPTPGVYFLAVGGASPASRGAAIPLVISPLLTNVASPPLLPGVGGIYTISGAGFVPNATQVWLGATPLQLVTTPPAPATGSFAVKGDGTTITFSLLANQPPGQTSVRLRVDGVDVPPAWQLVPP